MCIRHCVVMDTMMAQTAGQAPAYYKQQQQQNQMGMYAAAPTSSMYAQFPTLYSNGPSVMTPTGSPQPSHQKLAVLDTDVGDSGYFPSTPPLSTSGSTVASPRNFEALQTPMNPMFSGLEENEMPKEELENVETSVLDWSNCGSPPMTPGKWLTTNFYNSGLTEAIMHSRMKSTASYGPILYIYIYI